MITPPQPTETRASDEGESPPSSPPAPSSDVVEPPALADVVEARVEDQPPPPAMDSPSQGDATMPELEKEKDTHVTFAIASDDLPWILQLMQGSRAKFVRAGAPAVKAVTPPTPIVQQRSPIVQQRSTPVAPAPAPAVRPNMSRFRDSVQLIDKVLAIMSTEPHHVFTLDEIAQRLPQYRRNSFSGALSSAAADGRVFRVAMGAYSMSQPK